MLNTFLEVIMDSGLEVACLVLLLLIAGLLIRKGKLRSKSNPPPPNWVMKPPAPSPPPPDMFIERPHEWPTPPSILWLAEKDEKKLVKENTLLHSASLQKMVEAAKKIRGRIALGDSYHTVWCNYNAKQCAHCNCGMADLVSALEAFEASPPSQCAHCGAPLDANGKCLDVSQ